MEIIATKHTYFQELDIFFDWSTRSNSSFPIAFMSDQIENWSMHKLCFVCVINLNFT